MIQKYQDHSIPRSAAEHERAPTKRLNGKPPTPTQANALAVIIASIVTRSFPPTVAEIQDALNYGSPYTVTCILDALARRGIIKTMPMLSRGIVVNWGAVMVQCPQLLPPRCPCCLQEWG